MWCSFQFNENKCKANIFHTIFHSTSPLQTLQTPFTNPLQIVNVHQQSLQSAYEMVNRFFSLFQILFR